METENLIPANQFCEQYNVEFSFIHLLHENGLIELSFVHETECIPVTKLPELEKMVRLHYDLDINMEGIEAITNLLRRVEDMQHEITTLKNKLRLYEAIE